MWCVVVSHGKNRPKRKKTNPVPICVCCIMCYPQMPSETVTQHLATLMRAKSLGDDGLGWWSLQGNIDLNPKKPWNCIIQLNILKILKSTQRSPNLFQFFGNSNLVSRNLCRVLLPQESWPYETTRPSVHDTPISGPQNRWQLDIPYGFLEGGPQAQWQMELFHPYKWPKING